MPNGFRGEIHFFALFCEKLIKKPCLLIVQNQFHGMFARFNADIAVISAVFAVQSPGNLLVGLDDDAVGLERIDEVCVILLHQQGRNDLIQFQRVFRAFDQGYLEESVIQAYILSRQVFEAADGLGIRHHTVDILSLKGFPVCLDFNPVRRHIPDPFGSLQQVCQMETSVKRPNAAM